MENQQPEKVPEPLGFGLIAKIKDDKVWYTILTAPPLEGVNPSNRRNFIKCVRSLWNKPPEQLTETMHCVNSIDEFKKLDGDYHYLVQGAKIVDLTTGKNLLSETKKSGSQRQRTPRSDAKTVRIMSETIEALTILKHMNDGLNHS